MGLILGCNIFLLLINSKDSWWIPGGFLVVKFLRIPGDSSRKCVFTGGLPGILQESSRTGRNQEEAILVALAGSKFLEESSRNAWGSVKSSILECCTE